MARHFYFIICTLFLTACSSASADKKIDEVKVAQPAKTLTAQKSITAKITGETAAADSAYATYFVVIVDTGANYQLLHKKMFDVNSALNIPIDTMGRFYNPTKKLIALPDDDEDEIYAGDYFPRRYPSENLSLEYLSFYKERAGEKTIALVSGIYESERSADSALTVLKKAEKGVFMIKADIFIGCIH